MNFFVEIFKSPAFVAAFCAWFIAQGTKVIVEGMQHKKISIKRIIGAGGMPSSHSSSVMALTTAVGRINGVSSTEFAICLVFSLIVMYDATSVRHAAGKQAELLNWMIDNWHDNGTDQFNKKLKELLGHTPIQVFIGAILGIVVGLLVKI